MRNGAEVYIYINDSLKFNYTLTVKDGFDYATKPAALNVQFCLDKERSKEHGFTLDVREAFPVEITKKIAEGAPESATIELDKTAYNVGDTVEVTVTPAEGYLYTVSINGTDMTDKFVDNKYTFLASFGPYEITVKTALATAVHDSLEVNVLKSAAVNANGIEFTLTKGEDVYKAVVTNNKLAFTNIKSGYYDVTATIGNIPLTLGQLLIASGSTVNFMELNVYKAFENSDDAQLAIRSWNVAENSIVYNATDRKTLYYNHAFDATKEIWFAMKIKVHDTIVDKDGNIGTSFKGDKVMQVGRHTWEGRIINEHGWDDKGSEINSELWSACWNAYQKKDEGYWLVNMFDPTTRTVKTYLGTTLESIVYGRSWSENTMDATCTEIQLGIGNVRGWGAASGEFLIDAENMRYGATLNEALGLPETPDTTD